MKGTLLLAHGSRRAETEQTMLSIVRQGRELVDGEVEAAFLQFSDTDLETGLNTLVSRGVTDIAIVPYFLFAGVHILEDIPAELAEYQEHHPGITLRFGTTLGDDERLAQIVADRIRTLG